MSHLKIVPSFFFNISNGIQTFYPFFIAMNFSLLSKYIIMKRIVFKSKGMIWANLICLPTVSTGIIFLFGSGHREVGVTIADDLLNLMSQNFMLIDKLMKKISFFMCLTILIVTHSFVSFISNQK
jgi:hypothetical protein